MAGSPSHDVMSEDTVSNGNASTMRRTQLSFRHCPQRQESTFAYTCVVTMPFSPSSVCTMASCGGYSTMSSALNARLSPYPHCSTAPAR